MAFSECKIKNISGSIKTLHGKEFAINEIYQIQDTHRVSWATDDNVITAITDENFQIHDGGNNAVSGLNNQIDLLKDRYVEAETIKETALPKMYKGKATVSSQVATVLMKIPGTAGTDYRYLKGAFGWFENYHADDYIKAYLTDEDNILGYGAGTVIREFTDTEAADANEGWFAPPDKVIEIMGIETVMEILSGLYVKVVAYKGDTTADTFRVNMYWGKRE